MTGEPSVSASRVTVDIEMAWPVDDQAALDRLELIHYRLQDYDPIVSREAG